MPGTPTLVIEKDDGTTRHTLDCIMAEDYRHLIEQWEATATVDRSAWLDIKSTVDEITDRFRIERSGGSTFFEGRFRSDERDGNTIDITIDSYERDAQDAEPTGGRVSYANVADSDIVNDALNNVPTLQAGTVQTGDSSVSFTFAHASRAKQIRDAAEPAGQDVAYWFDRTVDFLDRLGSDKSNIAISSTSQNYVDELSVEDNSRDPVTHIRGLGAQHGADQVTASATIPSYTAGDRQVWREYVNKDIVNKDRLQSIVDRLATEYDSERRRIVVETTVLPNVDLEIGDRVNVSLPEHDIDRMLRCIKRREVLASGAGIIATLTNRVASRGGERKRRDDLGRFNAGDQGVLDRDTDSYGWQPVSASVNATRPYPYPSDVVEEHVAEVIVNSRPYRAYSQGAASGGGSTQTTTATAGTVVTDTTGTGFANATSASASETIPASASNQGLFATCVIDIAGGSIDRLQFRDATDNEVLHDLNVAGSNTSLWAKLPVDSESTNRTGHTIEATASFSSGTDGTIDVYVAADDEHDHAVSLPNHTHPVEPGLQDFPGETASNVDVIVNGTTVATNIGSGTFTATVDISGQLTAGDNTIEVSSDTLGLVNCTVQTQLFRRGRLSP